MMSSVSGLRLLVMFGAALSLSGCNDGSGDPNAQIGPNPNLPALQQYLLPPMHIAKVVGWPRARRRTAAKGLKIDGDGHGPAAPAIALYAAQRRYPGGGIQGAAGGSRSSGPRRSSWS